MESDFVLDYKAYLERFTSQFGEGVEFGKYAKSARGMVKKLRYEEFAEKFEKFTGLARRYQESVARGDTINEAVLRIIRDASVELLIDDSKYT
jgi:hypothetical protein